MKFLYHHLLFSLYIFCSLALYAQGMISIDEVRRGETGTLDVSVSIEGMVAGENTIDGTNTRIFERIGEGDSTAVTRFFIKQGTDSTQKIINLRPKQNILRGEQRTIFIHWNDTTVSKTFSIGDILFSENLQRELDVWLNIAAVGATFISAILLILALMVPFFRKQNFRSKYVKPYVAIKEKGRVQKDITGEPFEDNQLVVTFCKQVVSYESWKYFGNRCVKYPDCMYEADPCTHAERYNSSDRFFDQQGLYRTLNWVWFGALGGYSSWIIWALMNGLILPYSRNWDLAPAMESLIQGGMFGAAMGLGLSLWLSYVEVRGQAGSHKVNRILGRTFLGLLVGALSFGLVYYLTHPLRAAWQSEIWQEFVLYLPCWLLLGTGLGLVLSVRSTISPGRGILGGAVASLVGYGAYFTMVKILVNIDDEWGRMLGLILMGMILGVFIVSVVYRKGDYELKIISPEKFRKTVPINKWLKSDVDVMIGSDPIAQVFVNWDSRHVAPQHVRMTHSQNKVYIQPFAETLLNGKIASMDRPSALKHGDVIQLGRHGKTSLQFLINHNDKIPDSHQNTRTNSHSRQSFESMDMTSEDPSKIKIKRKPNI